MKHIDPFTKGIHKVQLARRLAWAMLLFYIPFALLLYHSSHVMQLPLFFLIIPYTLALVASILYMSCVPCPNCHDPFFMKEKGRNHLSNFFKMRCLNCSQSLHIEPIQQKESDSSHNNTPHRTR